MSEQELTEEQLKEQKLEAARKKYEELKKKKKKKGKKKTAVTEDGKDEDEDGDADENKEDSVEPEVKDEAKDDEDKDQETAGEPVEEGKVEKVVEPAADEPEAAQPDESTEKEENLQIAEETKDETNNEGVQEPVKEETRQEDIKELSAQIEALDVSVPSREISVAPTEIDEDQVDSLFPTSGPSFVESLKNSKLETELSQLRLTNEALLKENESLKTEVRDLKFIKIEHQEEIETLEHKVKDLEAKLSKLRTDSSAPSHYHPSTVGGQASVQQRSVYDDEAVSLSPSPSYQQPYQFQSNLSQFTNLRNDSSLSLNELKSKLTRWKGWNIDMTSWRSIGSGPVVEL